MTMPYTSQLAETSSKVEVRFGTTRPQRRVTVFFRLILLVPQFIVLYFVGIAAFVVVVIGWFAALFTGRLPESFAKFLLGYVRWTTRVYSYGFLMVDTYPPFSLDPDPTYPVDVLVTTGRLNRAAVFFRIILAIPAYVLATILNFGMTIFAFITWIITFVSGKMPDAFFGASAAVIRFQARTQAYVVMLTSYYPSDLLGDTDSLGARLESEVSGTSTSSPGGPVPGGGYGQTAAWGPTPSATYAQVPPPPPPGAFPPPPPGAFPPPPPGAFPLPPPGAFPPPPPMAAPPDPHGSATPSDAAATIPEGFGTPSDAAATIPEGFGTPSGTPIGAPPGVPTDESSAGSPPATDPLGPGTAGTPPLPPPPPPVAGDAPPPPPSYPTSPPVPPPPGAYPPPPPAGAYATGAYAPPPPPGAYPPGAYAPPPPPGAYPPGAYAPPPGAYPLGPQAGLPTSLWPLVLSKGARALAVVFIVLGAIGYVAYTAILASGVSVTSIETTVSRQGVENAYAQLSTATDSFKAQTQQCTVQQGASVLPCLEQADRTWATAIQDYGTSLSNLIYPPSAQTEAEAAQVAVRQATSIVTSLADSPDAQAYSTTSQSPAFQAALNDVDSTYTALVQALGG